MKTDTDTDWRKKYFDTLQSLEGEQQQFRAMEGTLKRLVGRLCSASLGQSPKLDEEIKKLQTAIRREANSSELDKITPALTDAIGALDQAPAAPAPSASAPIEPHERVIDDTRVRSIVAALLMELKRDTELIAQVDVLDAKLTTSLNGDQLPDVLSALAGLVGQRIAHIERAKQEVEVLLSQMLAKLDEIGRFVLEQNQNQNQSLASRETLSTHLVGEMKAMGESVDSASDVQQMRAQVRGRLESIGRHLQEFRQREVARANAIDARNEQMQARVAELEAEAKRLHSQLKDEQRLSTVDVLTNLPNRLAYDKRVEEELKRWQRFKQPTCIAVWDVDHFKRINDSYGHRAGDRVLRAIAESLTSRIRSTDFLARYGGEELIMILCGTKLDDAVRVVDEMRVAISKLPFFYSGAPFTVTISCGVTALLSGDSAAAAFDRADKALYQAKGRGRNCCVCSQ